MFYAKCYAVCNHTIIYSDYLSVWRRSHNRVTEIRKSDIVCYKLYVFNDNLCISAVKLISICLGQIFN